MNNEIWKIQHKKNKNYLKIGKIKGEKCKSKLKSDKQKLRWKI